LLRRLATNPDFITTGVTGVATERGDHAGPPASVSWVGVGGRARPRKMNRMPHETRLCPRGVEEAQGPHWYVVYTKPHQEETAQVHLQRKGLDTFFPRLRLPSPRRHRRHIIPLFPNYLFVQLHIPDDYTVVRWAPGVKHLVGSEGIPTPLDMTVVEFLRQRSAPDGISPARVSLTVGAGVRLVSGPFAGLMGIIENPPNAKGRVKVLMHLLSRQVRVEVPVDVVAKG
jgi:transcriptional antiterminator RfaH